MSVTNPNTPNLVDPESPSQPIPPGNGNGNGNGHPHPLRITSIAPIGGLLAGGYDVTLTGTGFQPDAEVFFGAVASPEVQVTSLGRVTAKVPPATQVGTVSVSLVNPDGESALAPGGFTYVSSEGSLHAEVLGVSPLSVIENTETEVTIRGRNLISAYNDGIVALRGPSRVQCAFSNFGSTTDSETGIDSLILTVRVTAAPPLEQHERIAIQVLASLRPDAANNGIFTSSRQMFTVLPRAVPVALAFTANLDPGRPNLVIVAGRNLDGISLDLGAGVMIHSQRSDDHTIAAVVSFPEGAPPTESLPLQLLDPSGQSAGQFDVTVTETLEVTKSASSADGTVMAAADPADGNLGLTLTPVPGQQLTGPTKEDSSIFSLRGESIFPSWGFGGIFFYDEFDIDILIPLFNEVRLIPFFDNGVGDFVDNTPVLAEVGKLFRLRGVGLLVTLRVDLIIHIHVVIIIGIIFFPWDFGFFNEFYDDFPFGIGSIVISISVSVQVFLSLAFMVALVEPGGHLRVLFYFNLLLEVDFFFSADNHVLRFASDIHFKVNYTRVSSFHNLLPCDGRFQLAEENGVSVFTDSFNGTVAFYFPRAEGRCCLSWNFDLQLVQFLQEGGPEEIVQSSFRTEYCLNAAPPTNVVNIIITSEHPAPTGIGPQRHLEMTFDDRALLKVLAEPADANGTPTGPPQDITTLGYDVEFYLDPFFPDLFNPVLLPSGDALPVQAGNNFIHARIHHPTDPELFNFRPEDVLGFVIQSFISQGLLPGVLAGVLPVTVEDPTQIIVTPTLAYVDPQNPNQLTESPILFTQQGDVVREMERSEPFETQQREYVVAVKLSFPTNYSFPATLKFKATNVDMRVLKGRGAGTAVGTDPVDEAPLKDSNISGRDTDKLPAHFFEKLVQTGQEIQINLQSKPAPNTLIPLNSAAFKIAPYIKDDLSQNHLVPPGQAVGDREVMLLIKLDETSTAPVKKPIKQMKLAVRNDETYEEYLRVLKETRALVSGVFQNDPKNFFDSLPGEGPPTADQLAAKGKDLWDKAVTEAQTSKDDRPLYWTRLQCICALRAYYKRNRLGQPTVSQFERPSRGLELNGSISFDASVTGRKAIVTGFDPFGLSSGLANTNPSGIVALWLNGKSIASTTIRTAIFPVRYKEFDEGLVETAVRSNLPAIALLMTVSQGGRRYDVERFAGKNRFHATSPTQIKDNNHLASTGATVTVTTASPPITRNDLTVPPGVPASSDPYGREFYESTLPYERVITDVEATRILPDPHTVAASYPENTDFVLNQGYSTVEGSSHPSTPNRAHIDSYQKNKAQPVPFVDAAHPGETSDEGSGQNFLSNEIFYRTARLRANVRGALGSGLLHIRIVGIGSDPTLSPGVNNAVEKALTKFLNDTLKLRSLGDLAFPDTPITRPSAPLQLKAQNETSSEVEVASVEVDSPQTFVLQTTLPARAPASGQLVLSFVFRPNDTIDFATIARVKDASGVILFSAQLRGKGIAAPPAPVVTGFSPTIGIIGDPVIINGTDFDAASEAKVGTVALANLNVTSTQIEAEITGPPRTGPISVTTPSGTGTSSQSFTVHAPPHHGGGDLAAQLVARRQELELNPQEAAAQIGAKPATYRRWEQGKDKPSARFHAAIVTFLGRDPNRDPKDFGRQIREARERDGLTRAQLAQRLGVSSSTVRVWEAGDVSRPSPRVEGIFEDYLNE